MLDIRCESCGSHVCYYQKDGPGPLKRMYLDRIFSSKYQGLQNLPFKKLQNFLCPKCRKVLGMPIVYEKEKRLAFRLFQDEVTKKIINLSELK